MSETVYVYRRRRTSELALILLGQFVAFAGYLLIYINVWNKLPEQWPVVAMIWFGMGLVIHLIVRWRLPYADPTLVPIAFAMTGLGLVGIHRYDLAKLTHGAEFQLLWTGLGLVLFILVVFLFRDPTVLGRFPYIMFIVGLVLLLLPLVPGLGDSGLAAQMGSKIWIKIGPYSFQPGEFAKIALSIAFAGYLVSKRDVLSLAGHRVLGLDLPRGRDLGPIAIMWVASILVLVYEKDLGTSFLFFGLFVMMLYVATQRVGWVILGLLMFSGAALVAVNMFDHVQTRIGAWLDPWADHDKNFQLVQAAIGLDWGGIGGTGLGLGSPWIVPIATSDMIVTSLTEEIGLAGFFAIVVCFAFLIARSLRIALTLEDDFSKLLTTGLAFTFALQFTAIVGGSTRLLPLTGLTVPFMSQGGTSLIANWAIIGALMVLSHRARRPQRHDSGAVDVDFAEEMTQVLSVGSNPHDFTQLLNARRDDRPTPSETTIVENKRQEDRP